MTRLQLRAVWLLAGVSAMVTIAWGGWELRANDHARREQTSSRGQAAREPAHGPARSGLAATPATGASIDWPGLLARTLRIHDRNERSMAFGNAVRGWLRENPDAALDYVRHRIGRRGYTPALLIVLDEIGKTSPERALRLTQEMVFTRKQAAIYSLLFARLTDIDPRRAVQDLGLAPAHSRVVALRALSSVWAERDPTAALAWAETLDSASEQPVAIEAVAAVLARFDPLRAIDLAHRFLAGEASTRVMTASLHSLSHENPESAGALVLDLPAGETQTTAALNVARSLAAQRPESALAWIDTLPAGELHQAALNNVLDVWSRDQPADSKKYVFDMPLGTDQDVAAAHLAADLAATDPAGTISWATSLNGAAARNGALVSVASAWARSDAEAATRWVDGSNLDSATRQEALGGALSYWVTANPTAAANFIPTLSEADQPRALLVVAPVLAQNDPASALAWAQTFSNEDIRALAVDGVVNRWSDNDPAAAAYWVESEPQGNAQIDHIRTVEQQWLPKDASNALAWIPSLPVGAGRDAAVDAAAQYFALQQPELALNLANSIASPALRSARLGVLSHSVSSLGP